jgi:hypothetical protein
MLASVVGYPVASAWRGHGSALFLELGRIPTPRTATATARHPRGEASIMIEWSWRVERRGSIAFGSFSSDARIDTGIASLAGPSVLGVAVVGRLPELSVALSDGRHLQSFMTAAGQPAWTVFLPDGSWVHVERGRLVHDTSLRRRSSARKSSA